MKPIFIKITFFSLLFLFCHCKADFNELDINHDPDPCQKTHIELDLQSRMYRSPLTNYIWKDWTDGLNIDWTNDGKTLIFSFPPNFICNGIANIGAEIQDICPLLHSNLNFQNQSFTFHLSQCLVKQPSIFLSLSHH